MKNLYVLLALFFTTFCFSQTTTKKYNDLRNRWEYYNSSGQMVGYEKYNSLREQWEYTDLSQNVSSRVHNYGDPQSTFDTDLAIMALAAKQKQYNQRKEYRNQKIKYILSVVPKTFRANEVKFQRLNNIDQINEAKKIVNKWWQEYVDRNFKTLPIPNADVIISHINERTDEAIELVKSKYRTQEKSQPEIVFQSGHIDLSISESDLQLGGYTTNKIIEFRWNTITQKYEVEKVLNIESKLYFADTQYFFKRGNNVWKGSQWSFLGASKDDKTGEYSYRYSDNYDQLIIIDPAEHTITWAKKKKNGINGEIIVYTNLTPDPSIQLK